MKDHIVVLKTLAVVGALVLFWSSIENNRTSEAYEEKLKKQLKATEQELKLTKERLTQVEEMLSATVVSIEEVEKSHQSQKEKHYALDTDGNPKTAEYMLVGGDKMPFKINDTKRIAEWKAIKGCSVQKVKE